MITEPSGRGKPYFITNSFSKPISEFERIYIYSLSLHQNFYQKGIECFHNYIPIQIIPQILNENYIDLVIVEIVNDEDFEKRNQTQKQKLLRPEKKMKFPHEYEDGGIIILDDSNEKEMNDSRAPARCKRPRHENLSIFIIRQDYYELPKRTMRANGSIYHIFKTFNLRVFQNLYQGTATFDMSLQEFKNVITICWEDIINL